MGDPLPDRAARLKTRALIVAVILANVAGNTLLGKFRLPGAYCHAIQKTGEHASRYSRKQISSSEFYTTAHVSNNL
jgi:hypothetical protein